MYENGRLQPITVFDYGDAPIALGVVVDRSQSMRPKTLALGTALSSLLVERSGRRAVRRKFPRRRLTGARPRVLHEPMSAIRCPPSALQAARATCGEGLRHELGRSQKKGAHRHHDGGDNASRQTYAQVLMLARRSDAVIYAIGSRVPEWRRKRKTQGCSSASPEKRAAKVAFHGRLKRRRSHVKSPTISMNSTRWVSRPVRARTERRFERSRSRCRRRVEAGCTRMRSGYYATPDTDARP